MKPKVRALLRPYKEGKLSYFRGEAPLFWEYRHTWISKRLRRISNTPGLLGACRSTWLDGWNDAKTEDGI